MRKRHTDTSKFPFQSFPFQTFFQPNAAPFTHISKVGLTHPPPHPNHPRLDNSIELTHSADLVNEIYEVKSIWRWWKDWINCKQAERPVPACRRAGSHVRREASMCRWKLHSHDRHASPEQYLIASKVSQLKSTRAEHETIFCAAIGTTGELAVSRYITKKLFSTNVAGEPWTRRTTYSGRRRL